MLPILFVIIIFGFIFYAGMVSSRKLAERRQAAQAQIDTLRARMQGFYEQSRSLDEKTAERVAEAYGAVNVKLDQARGLLPAAAKENHFDRIQRILTQAEAKVGNAQAGIGRAQARVQRQTEAEQRREEARAQKAVSRVGRGSFAPPAEVTNAQTDWNAVPAGERGVCFFCSRPCLLRELTPVTVPIAGRAQRVLACPQDLAIVRAGNLPPIRAFAENGQRVPWYAYSRYNPYHDYYLDNFAVDIYVERYPFDVIAPIYWNFDAPYVYDNGPAYVFSPEAESYQDYMSAAAAGAAYANVPGYDPNNPNFDPNFDPNNPDRRDGEMDFQSGQGADYPGNTGNFAAGPDAS